MKDVTIFADDHINFTIIKNTKFLPLPVLLHLGTVILFSSTRCENFSKSFLTATEILDKNSRSILRFIKSLPLVLIFHAMTNTTYNFIRTKTVSSSVHDLWLTDPVSKNTQSKKKNFW